MVEYIEKEAAIRLIQKNATREKFEGSRAKAKGMLLAKYIIESISAANVREIEPIRSKGDRIRAMSDEELAEWLVHITPACPPGVDDNDDYNCAARNDCKRCCLDWLKSPAEENEIQEP